jgi:hypothetical protein
VKASTILQRARETAEPGLGFTALYYVSRNTLYEEILFNACDAMFDMHGRISWFCLDSMRATFDIAISMALSDEACS